MPFLICIDTLVGCHSDSDSDMPFDSEVEPPQGSEWPSESDSGAGSESGPGLTIFIDFHRKTLILAERGCNFMKNH